MKKKIRLIFYTLIHLKPVQVYYRLYYFFKNRIFIKEAIKKPLVVSKSIKWNNKLNCNYSYSKNKTFTFLNITHQFSNQIDWNYAKYGKLWTYNLNYFDFLNQKGMSKDIGIVLLNDYIKNDKILKDGKESYPISLRGINWVKFLTKNEIENQLINNTLFNHYKILYNNIEYHLLGNHILENAFSLLFGAYYFQDKKLYNKSRKILEIQLNEQILEDGGHFELSPMYHQIILLRVLDCIQLIKLNNWKNDNLLNFLKVNGSKMLSWLDSVTFNNGDIPMVNDSAHNIAFSTKDLLYYGKYLGINRKNIKLSESGYRMYKNKKYELFMDLGGVKASYQPGHTHSDTFNFILYINNQPFIVDSGTSTYEKNKRRQLERSTSSHNTITIGDYDQTEVWGGFRVAKRAKIVSFNESDKIFSSSHNGYNDIGVIHNRKFITNIDSIEIYDDLKKQDIYKEIAHFHFHPNVKDIIVKDSRVYFDKLNVQMLFDGGNVFIEKECYKYATGFNKTENAIKLKVVFKSNLKTIINL